MAGEAESGDASLVMLNESFVLLALIDGLGHGPSAREASLRAVELLSDMPALPLADLVQRCHEGLRGTRGAVMALVRIWWETAELEWTGVGNVDAFLLRPVGPREYLISRGGVVGHHLPPIRVSRLQLSGREFIVLASDGMRSEILEDLRWPALSLEGLPTIFESYRRDIDDAHLLAAEYAGRGVP